MTISGYEKQALLDQIAELKEEIARQQQIVANYRADFQTLFLKKNRLNKEKDDIRKKLRNKQKELDDAHLNQELTAAWSEKRQDEINYLQQELDKRDKQIAKIRQQERAIQKPLKKIEKKQQLLIIGEIADDRDSVKKAFNKHYRTKYDKESPWEITFWSNKELKSKNISHLKKQRSKYNLLIVGLLHNHHSILGSDNLISDLLANRETYIETILPKRHEKKALSTRQLLHKLDKYESSVVNAH